MNKRIMIFGDIMLDSYTIGKTSRISPEAPVPVIQVNERRKVVGGAGNVAHNIQSLGGVAAGVFLLGVDEGSKELSSMIKRLGIKSDWITYKEGINAIVKERVVAGNQQIVRLDFNDSVVVDDAIEVEIANQIDEAIKWADMVIISDYNKGLCTRKLCEHIISEANKRSIPIIVDPKGREWGKYKGATVITPNMKEIAEFLNLDIPNDDTSIERNLRGICSKIGVKNVLVTRSEKGMSLIDNTDKITHINAVRRDVYDVSGAGDTVVATLGLYLNKAKSNIYDAMNLANIAAGIAVSKPGTAVVSAKELKEALNTDRLSITKKVFSINNCDELCLLIDRWREQGNHVVTTNGCFDILHRGHIELLERAKQAGDKLVVLINSDQSVKRLKGESRPINSELDRAFVIASLNSVDAVYIFDPQEEHAILTDDEQNKLNPKLVETAKEAPMKVMKLIRPDIHVKGGDYSQEDVPEAIFANKFIAVNFVEGYSTTNIIKKSKGNNN